MNIEEYIRIYNGTQATEVRKRGNSFPLKALHSRYANRKAQNKTAIQLVRSFHGQQGHTGKPQAFYSGWKNQVQHVGALKTPKTLTKQWQSRVQVISNECLILGYLRVRAQAYKTSNTFVIVYFGWAIFVQPVDTSYSPISISFLREILSLPAVNPSQLKMQITSLCLVTLN